MCVRVRVAWQHDLVFAGVLHRDVKLYFNIIRMSSWWPIAGIPVRSVMARDMCPGLCVVSRARVKQTLRVFLQLGEHAVRSSMLHGCVHNPNGNATTMMLPFNVMWSHAGLNRGPYGY
jgi:hypothetical protein